MAMQVELEYGKQIEFEKDGLCFSILVDRDSDTPDPIEWHDMLGTMVCWHKRYNLGHKHGFARPEDFQEEANAYDWITLPLYLYDHSGITISTRPFSCPWDSGQVGWIYAPRGTLRKEYSVKHVTKGIIAQAKRIMEAEVATYDDWLVGNVHGYSVQVTRPETCEHCGDTSYAEVGEDSRWGFYGDVEDDLLHQLNGFLQKYDIEVAME